MVVQEESGSDVESYEHIDGVVFVCSQDEEDTEEIQDPGQRVNKVPASWSICEIKKEQQLTIHSTN